MRLASINSNYLVVFEAIHRTRSVSKAARELGLTQSGVSNALAQLRSLFEDPLFERVGNRMVPTPRGEQLAPDIAVGVAAFARALLPAAFEPSALQRTITIGMPDYVQMVVLQQLATSLAEQAPHASLRVVTTTAHAVPDALASGDLDLYVGFADSIPERHRASNLYEDDFILIARRGHPAIRSPRSRPSVKTWIRYGHVVVSGQPRQPTGVDRALAEIGVQRRVVAVLDQAAMVAATITATDWIAAVGRRWGQRLVDDSGGGLVAGRCPLSLPRGRVRQVFHDRRTGDPMHRWLRALVQDCVASTDTKPRRGRSR